MIAFRRRFGGHEIKFPYLATTLTEDHPIVVTIGREIAEKLCFELSGMQLYVPHALGYSYLDSIEKAYVEAYRSGLTNTEIAEKRGVSSRQVRRMMSKLGISNENHKSRVKNTRNARGKDFPQLECIQVGVLTPA